VLRAGPLPAESGAVDVPHLESCPSRAVARDSGKPNFGGFSLDVKLSPIYLDIKLPTGITMYLEPAILKNPAAREPTLDWARFRYIVVVSRVL
jgi:hypothetical protein